MITLTVLGSGTFFVTDATSSSAFLLDTGSKKILVDCGPGTLVNLSRVGVAVNDLDYVFITHLHPDHTSDLFPLFMNFRLMDVFAPGTLKKYPVFCGPMGTEEYMLDYSHLTELHSWEGYNMIKVKEYMPRMKLDDFMVKTYPVTHKTFGVDVRAFALRFEVQKKVVAFSGDSAKCNGIEMACREADLFVCDTSYPEEWLKGFAKGMDDHVHMSTTILGEISEKAHVKKILLTHFYPQFKRYKLEEEVKGVYKGEVVSARDGESMNV